MLARWCFSHRRRLSTVRQFVPREEDSKPCRHPRQVSGGAPAPRGSGHISAGSSSPGCWQHRKQRALLMYMSLCGFWSQPHPTFKPAQAARATGNGQECIYSHIVFIQSCCFEQIIMNFFTGRGHSVCPFLRAPWEPVKLISLNLRRKRDMTSF